MQCSLLQTKWLLYYEVNGSKPFGCNGDRKNDFVHAAIIQLPGMMTGMIIAGADPVEAVRYHNRIRLRQLCCDNEHYSELAEL